MADSIKDRDILDQFIAAINDQNLDMMQLMLSEDHQFIDSTDEKTIGREAMMAFWKSYFDLFSHYRIEVEEVIGKDTSLGVFGHAKGQLKNPGEEDGSWESPAAYRTEIRDGRIHVWQVYADSDVVYNMMKATDN